MEINQHGKLMDTEAVVQKCSVKKVFLKISQNLPENTLCQSLLFKKETLAQVFLSEFYKIFKNTYFYTTPLVAASLDCRPLHSE